LLARLEMVVLPGKGKWGLFPPDDERRARVVARLEERMGVASGGRVRVEDVASRLELVRSDESP